jgi:3-hydroxyisobutyrate dehydrogenase-like beta-hydroxyacid dehydrogenase
MNSDSEIGLIGVGLLGTAIAERLIGAGQHVVGYDIDPESRERLARLGGRSVGSLNEVAECSQIILSLPDSIVAGQVIDELRPALAVDAVLIDTTTGDPTDAALMAEELAGYHIGYVDATVLGSSEVVRRGEAILLLGGRDVHVQVALELLQPIYKRAFPIGPAGSGSRMKLAVNLVLGLHRAVLAEGLAFAKSLGLDPRQTLEVLKSGPAASAAMESKGEMMLTGDFAPQARLKQHLKDVRLILEAARRMEAKTPLSDVHQQMLAKLVEQGHGDEDNSAVLRWYE